jgi:2-polyprenyl-3-methyl-5-hydroxy-6-metoxy-1,4-benzoquinol methylase
MNAFSRMPPEGCPVCPACRCSGAAVPTKIQIHGHTALFKCSRCRTHYVWPKPSAAELDTIYGKGYYDSWALGAIGLEGIEKIKENTFNRILDIIAQYKTGGTILDIGCAFGHFLDAAEKRGWTACGVEFSEAAAGTAGHDMKKGRIWQGDFIHLQMPTMHFDVITMIDVIEHEYETSSFLRKAHSLLRPDGIMVIVTPDVSSLSCRIMGKFWPHFNQEHLVCFSRQTIQSVLSAEGFAVIGSSPFSKAFNLFYLRAQIGAHCRRTVTSLVNVVLSLVPKRFWGAVFFMLHGEMLVIAAKKGGCHP